MRGSALQECPFTRLKPEGSVLMPTGGPYMLVANLDESIANCLTWDLYKKGMLKHVFVVGLSSSRAVAWEGFWPATLMDRLMLLFYRQILLGPPPGKEGPLSTQLSSC